MSANDPNRKGDQNKQEAHPGRKAAAGTTEPQGHEKAGAESQRPAPGRGEAPHDPTKQRGQDKNKDEARRGAEQNPDKPQQKAGSKG